MAELGLWLVVCALAAVGAASLRQAGCAPRPIGPGPWSPSKARAPAPWRCWAVVAIQGSGACTLALGGSPWSPVVGYGLGTLYPGLLRAGARLHAGRPVPGWLRGRGCGRDARLR